MKMFLEFREKWLEQMPDNEENKHRNPFHLNILHMTMVGNKLVDRYNEREQAIHDMTAEDKARDARFSAARLAAEPYCEHCNKTGLRITEIMFMHRENQKEDNILFMLRCPNCEKNTAVWGGMAHFGSIATPSAQSVRRLWKQRIVEAVRLLRPPISVRIARIRIKTNWT